MNFNDSSSDAAFRAEARAWLEANVPEALRPRADGVYEVPSEAERLAIAKAWQATKHAAGYAAITWPKEFGGRDGTSIQALIFSQEEASFAFSTDGIFGIGMGMCLPIVRIFGDAVQRERYLQRGLSGDEVWCQLFSEPSAGSDVAGVRTSGVRDGDDWVINGQKVWTSGAQFCDFGIVLVRTDPTMPKHKGLTMFVIDMKAPGVTVRPIRQMTGESEFNEVFFDNVRIPDRERLGEPGEGWKVAVATLMHERSSVGAGLGFVDHGYLLDLARRVPLRGRPAIEDDRVRETAVNMYINSHALKLLNFRAQTALSKGETPGPEQSISKAVAAAQGQQAAYLAMDLLDRRGILAASELGDDWIRVERSWTWGAAMRIAGGSDEILRNIIAERVLGLPADIRVDKDIAFRDLPA